ncbi:hypothetical protein BC940DRAFT_12994 [Gongronella butleri]|nr:hypothetical protein BC940DRAFT_12994 [Gongronella butleri]
MRTLVKPLRKLSLLSVPPLKRTQTNSDSSGDTPPTKTVAPSSPSLEQQGRVLRLPDEIALCILSQLDFENLVQAQLTCRLWRSLAQDAYLWKRPCGAITSQHEDLKNFGDDDALSWPARYCRLQSKLNWKMGAVQRVKLINVPTSRLLSVKLRDQLLLTLSEDNVVQLYKYDVEQGFVLNLTWKFCGQRQVECIDLLPEIHTVVVACRGSKCMFYDVASKNPLEPIQVLKGGAHSWFIPDDVALTCDYFALSGRKPSAVFVWNWRKGVRLSHKVRKGKRKKRNTKNSPRHLTLLFRIRRLIISLMLCTSLAIT